MDTLEFCWFDKTYFEIGENNNVIYIIHTIYKAYFEECFKPSFKSNRVSIRIWSCFIKLKKGPFMIFSINVVHHLAAITACPPLLKIGSNA